MSFFVKMNIFSQNNVLYTRKFPVFERYFVISQQNFIYRLIIITNLTNSYYKVL